MSSETDQPIQPFDLKRMAAAIAAGEYTLDEAVRIAADTAAAGRSLPALDPADQAVFETWLRVFLRSALERAGVDSSAAPIGCLERELRGDLDRMVGEVKGTLGLQDDECGGEPGTRRSSN